MDILISGWVQTELGSSKNREPPVTVPQSASAIVKVGAIIPKAESGTYWSFDGTKLPY